MPLDPSRPLGAQALALQRRLAVGDLSAKDKEQLERTRVILDGRSRGVTVAKVADQLGWKRVAVSKFTATPTYQVLANYLGEQRDLVDEKTLQGQQKVWREKLGAMTPRALSRLQLQLDGGITTEGLLVDSKAADRAMELVLGSAGLLDAEGAARPAIHIDQLVINQQIVTAMQDDRVANAIDVTPLQVSP